ncbi:MAG: hypothetical protein JSU81_04525 [Candidatus Coatesbacteria bacterium]|nr:MAG: hypothetical protein JSU81_04525 [Candidatus Coatesbacteria bacterium]
MDQTLATLATNRGVRGAFVAAYAGRILARTGLDDVNGEIVSAAVPYLARVFGALRLSGVKGSIYYLSFHDGRLVAADLGGACLVLACDLDAEMSRLRMSLNVAAADLRRSEDLAAAVPGAGTAPPPANAAGLGGEPAAILRLLESAGA